MPAAARSRRLTVHFPPLRPAQRTLFASRKRFNVWCCHRRMGKTLLALYCLIHDAYADPLPAPRYAYIAPLFRSAKALAWDYLRRLLTPLPGVKFNEAELRADLHTGARIQLYGSDTPDTLRGLYFSGVVLDEAAQMRPRLWPEIVRPALADREGWAIHISTPLGHNAFYDLYRQAEADPQWHVATYKASETGIVSDAELASARAVMSPEQYAQEFECFPPESLVLTSRGASPIAEIQVGDMVLSHRGRWRQVTKTFSRPYTGPMVVLETWGGQPVHCTPEHPVWIANWREQTYRWVPAQNVQEGDYVCFPRHAMGRPLISAELATLLAWYIGEGSLGRNAVHFSLGPTEHAYAQNILDAALALGWKGTVTACPPTLAVVIGSTQLADFLALHCGQGSWRKQLPLPLIVGHERLVWDTLFAADGHIRVETRNKSKYSQAWYYSTTSEALALSLQTLGHTLGYQGTYTFRRGVPSNIGGRTGPGRDSYWLVMRIGGNNSVHARVSPPLRQAKIAVVAKVRRVRRDWHDGAVYNLAVAFDESYTVYGRAVHNCSYESALIGSYYGSYLETAQADGRLSVVPWQSQHPVHTAWDLGVSDATAIWFVQPVGQALHVIDYLEATDHGLEWYVRTLREKPYVYGRHYFPHDIAARDWSQDGRTRLQIAESLGLRPAVVVPQSHVANGIQAVRTLFPRFWFDATACHDGLEALKAYRREWDETRRTWKDTPLHDFSSHAADSLRTFAMGYEEQRKPVVTPLEVTAGRGAGWRQRFTG